MPDYMIILIILMAILIGSALKWMANDIAKMHREEEELERWLGNGRS